MSELRGRLGNIGLTPVLRFLAAEGRTGCLKISLAGLVGEIAFHDGHIVSAVSGDERGEAALEVIALALVHGDFVYTDRTLAEQESARVADPGQLQLHLERLMSGADAHPAPPMLTSVPRVATLTTDGEDRELALSRADLALLFELDGQHTTADVLRRHYTLSTLRTLEHLSQVGVVEWDTPPPATRGAVAEAEAAAMVIGATVPLEFPKQPPSEMVVRDATGDQRRLSGALLYALAVVVLGSLLIIGFRTVAESVYVEADSTVPSLHQGDLLLVDKTPYLFGQPRPSDVVVFESNDGNYFVVSDERTTNPASPQGSFGPADHIVGRAWLVYWPPADWGFVHRETPSNSTTSGVDSAPPMAMVAATPFATFAPEPTAESTPQPAPLRAAVLLSGRVNDQPGWPSDPTSTAWLEGASYHVQAKLPSEFVAVAAPITSPLADVVVSASLHKVGGPPGGGYGVFVRDQAPGRRDGVDQHGPFYVAEAGDQGEFGLWRRDATRWVDLVPWTHSDAVNIGGTTNEVTLRAQGPRLAVAINGTEVASVSETTLSNGRVGVFVGGDANDVMLDRFSVELLSEE